MIELILAIIATVVGGLLLQWVMHIDLKALFLRNNDKEKNITIKNKIIYVSAGGTCRDPMAAAITKKLIDEKKLDINVQFEAMALAPVSRKNTSFAACKAIEKLLGDNLLRNHIPKTITEKDIKEAILILVMDKSLLNYKILPKEKTYLLKTFFGDEGDIADPWPDGRDEKTLSRYYKTAEELQLVISKNIDKLINAIK